MSSRDALLISRWAKSRDAEAFDELVSRYAGMVYATSKRILRNDEDAKDVTQECFICLSQNHPRIRASLGGWLHALATHRSLNFLRSSSRRRRREETFTEERLRAAKVEWNDIQDHVDEAIQKLPEKLRSAVIDHFLQRQTHEEIAKEAGLSRRAVSYRIGKGVEGIRKSLRRKGISVAAGSLAAMLSTNAAQATPASLAAELGRIAISGAVDSAVKSASAQVVGSSWAKTLGGLIAMKGKLAIFSVLLLFLVGLLVFVRRDREEPIQSSRLVDQNVESTSSVVMEPPGQQPVEASLAAATVEKDIGDEEQTDIDLPGQDLEDTRPPDVPETKPLEKGEIADPAEYASISGYVLEKDGTPIRGAEIILMAVGFTEEEASRDSSVIETGLSWSHHFTATSRHDGAYQITGIRYKGVAMMFVNAEGYGQSLRDIKMFSIQPGEALQDVDMFLSPGMSITGRVLTADGLPVGDATVFESGMGSLAHTDQVGRFAMSIRPEASNLNFMVISTTQGNASFKDLEFPPGDYIELRIEGNASLAGRVVWHDGTPAEGVIVYLVARWDDGSTNDAPQFEAQVDEQGRYDVSLIDPGVAYHVSVLSEQGTPLSPQVDVGKFEPGEVRTWDYTIQDIITVHGVLFGEQSGDPLPGFQIVCEKAGKRVTEAQTESDGSYELLITAGAGSYLIYPKPTKHKLDEYFEEVLVNYSREVTAKAGEELGLDLNILDPFAITVRFVDTDGNPIRGGKAWAYTMYDRDGNTSSIVAFLPDGGYTWTRFMPGRESWLSFRHQDYVKAESTHRVGEPGEVFPAETVTVYRPSGVEGTVVDEEGNPFADTRFEIVAYYDEEKETRVPTTSDGQGNFVVTEGVPATIVELEIRTWTIEQPVQEYVWVSEPLEFLPGYVHDLGEIVLSPLPAS